MIAANKEWEFAGLYADEGISGTRADKRPEFQKMIKLLSLFLYIRIALYFVIFGIILYFNFDTIILGFVEYFLIIMIFEFILLEVIILNFLKRIKEKFFEETK